MNQQATILIIAGCLLCFAAIEVSSQGSDDVQDQANTNLVGDKIEGGLESVEDYFAMAPEDELESLSEEHRTIKEDCLNLKTQIDQATADGTPVDPQLQADYDQCQSDLAEVESDMQEVTAEMTKA